MNRMMAFKTELGEHSASDSIASNGYSRLKRRPRMRRKLIAKAMQAKGLSQDEARSRMYLDQFEANAGSATEIEDRKRIEAHLISDCFGHN
jgi:hypothetical protein